MKCRQLPNPQHTHSTQHALTHYSGTLHFPAQSPPLPPTRTARSTQHALTSQSPPLLKNCTVAATAQELQVAPQHALAQLQLLIPGHVDHPPAGGGAAVAGQLLIPREPVVVRQLLAHLDIPVGGDRIVVVVVGASSQQPRTTSRCLQISQQSIPYSPYPPFPATPPLHNPPPTPSTSNAQPRTCWQRSRRDPPSPPSAGLPP